MLDELILSTDVFIVRMLLVFIVGLCTYILIQNKVIREYHNDYKVLIEKSTIAITELTTLIRDRALFK